MTSINQILKRKLNHFDFLINSFFQDLSTYDYTKFKLQKLEHIF
jgi:hypothetical protein